MPVRPGAGARSRLPSEGVAKYRPWGGEGQRGGEALSGANNLVEGGLDGGAEGVGGAVVEDDHIGAASFFFFTELGGFAAGEFGVVPVSGIADAGQAGGARRIHEDDAVAFLIDAGFEKEGRIDHDGGGVALGRGTLGGRAPGADDRVDDGFEAAALGGVVEDDVGDGAAGDAAAGVEDRGPPPLDELRADFGLVEGFLGLGVGIDDDRAEGSEDSGDLGFSGAGRTGEADDGGI